MFLLRRKFIVFLLGIVVCLVALEGGLRLTGYFCLKNAARDKVNQKEANSYIILCVGDSFTYGSGAPSDKSYPRQLEKLLNADNSKVTYQVINRGVGGYNTFSILSKLGGWITEFNPDLVVILAGGNNIWYAQGYIKYTKEKTLSARIYDSIQSIKVYKLVKLLSKNIQKQIKSDQKKDRQIHLSEEFNNAWNKARNCENEGEWEEGIRWYKIAMELEPEYCESYWQIARIYALMLHDDEIAYEYAKKAIEINPNEYQPLGFFISNFLSQKPEIRNENIKFLSQFEEESEIVRDFIKREKDLILYLKTLQGWVNSDITRMINICKDKEIPVIIQNYPKCEDIWSFKDMNYILQEVAENNGATYIDNEKRFNEIWKDKEEYLSIDRGHPNAQGYGAMAQNICKHIKKLNSDLEK